MSMPMFAAVPAMILIADSMVVQFRSGSFSAAIVRSWSIVITPTLSCCGSFDPLSTPISTTNVKHHKNRRNWQENNSVDATTHTIMSSNLYPENYITKHMIFLPIILSFE